MSGRPKVLALAAFRRILYGQCRDPHDGWIQLSIEKILVHAQDLIATEPALPRRDQCASFIRYKQAVIEHGMKTRAIARDRILAIDFFWGNGESGVGLFCDVAGLSTGWVLAIMGKMDQRFGVHPVATAASEVPGRQLQVVS